MDTISGESVCGACLKASGDARLGVGAESDDAGDSSSGYNGGGRQPIRPHIQAAFSSVEYDTLDAPKTGRAILEYVTEVNINRLILNYT